MGRASKQERKKSGALKTDHGHIGKKHHNPKYKEVDVLSLSASMGKMTLHQYRILSELQGKKPDPVILSQLSRQQQEQQVDEDAIKPSTDWFTLMKPARKEEKRVKPEDGAMMDQFSECGF